MAASAAESESSTEYSSSSDSESGSSDESRSAAFVQRATDLVSEDSDPEVVKKLDWETADLPTNENPPPAVILLRRKEDFKEWDGLGDTNLIAIYGRKGFNKRINGVYRKLYADQYKQEGSVDDIFLYKTNKAWILSSKVNSTSSFGYIPAQKDVPPSNLTSVWKIYNENGQFEEDLDVRIRALPGEAAGEEFLINRKRVLTPQEKAAALTLALRGKKAKVIAQSLLLNEETCETLMRVAAYRYQKRETRREEDDDAETKTLVQALSIIGGKSEDEVAFALRTTLGPGERLDQYDSRPSVI